MPKAQLVYIAGDLHGDWDAFNPFLNAKIRQSRKVRELASVFEPLEILILQTGDFGYWPHKHKDKFFSRSRTPWRQDGVKNAMPGVLDERIKIYWCDGNHENHDVLDALERERHSSPADRRFIEVMPGVYYAPFGAVLRLLGGTQVLFCGGAESTDKDFRIQGDTWWPQETIGERDMANLPSPERVTVDWVISHTCPGYFSLDSRSCNPGKNSDPSKMFLNRVFDRYRPKRWWFGHYHDFQTGVFDGCAWTMLDRCGKPGGGRWMERGRIIKEA